MSKQKQRKKNQSILPVRKEEFNFNDECDSNDSNNDQAEDPLNNGYCHFNDNGSNTTFSIDLFGYHLELNQNPDSNIGHGAVVWDASVVFSKYIEHNPSFLQFENKNVIELGTGCGLAGICLMLKGAHVTMTDLKEVVDTLTVHNVERIFHQVKSMGSIGRREIHKPRIYALDWTTFPSLKSSSSSASSSSPSSLAPSSSSSSSSSISSPAVPASKETVTTTTTTIEAEIESATSVNGTSLSTTEDLSTVKEKDSSSALDQIDINNNCNNSSNCNSNNHNYNSSNNNNCNNSCSNSSNNSINNDNSNISINHNHQKNMQSLTTVAITANEIISQSSYDIILLTDCIFSILLVPSLIQTLLKLSSHKTEIICCHEIRDEEANMEFIQQLKIYYTIKMIANSKLHPDYQNNLIQTITAKLKRQKSSS